MSLKDLLKCQGDELALVIGNGINQYGNCDEMNSWDNLLMKLARDYIDREFDGKLDGVSLTEFYDVLEFGALDKAKINSKQQGKDEKINLQERFCELMSAWKPETHHESMVKYCNDKRIPILTTNFDTVLSDAIECKLYKTTSKGFTHYYPWEYYYAREELTGPTSGFGIWHINGMKKYSSSIRLGLTHYMGSVHRARSWIYPSHSSGSGGLHENGRITNWRGHNTWLQILMTRPLVFFACLWRRMKFFYDGCCSRERSISGEFHVVAKRRGICPGKAK